MTTLVVEIVSLYTQMSKESIGHKGCTHLLTELKDDTEETRGEGRLTGF